MTETGILSGGERDGSTVRLYVDGVLQASGNTGKVVPLDGTISTFIGKDARANASYFNGLIDEVKVSICSDVAPTTRVMTSSVTGIVKQAKPTENKLYPNPASSVVTLQLVDDVTPGKDIQTFDGVGKRVFIHFTKTGEGTYTTNVAVLVKGIYFIKVKTEKGTETFRFIKG